MRRQLVIGAAAITTTVVVAFVVPLGLAVRTLASSSALSDAEQTARSLATVFAFVDDPAVRRQTLEAEQAQTPASLTAFDRDGGVIGAQAPADSQIERAFDGVAFRAPADGGGQQVLVPVISASGTDAVIRAFVPAEVLGRGVGRAWLILGALAVSLIAVAVLVADWLGRAIVMPVLQLADAARSLGHGKLDTRVAPAGPSEVADVGRAMNTLAGQIATLLASEREMVADLSHRLRTPLTALRLDAESVRDPDDAARLRADVAAVEETVNDLILQARNVGPTGPTTVLLEDVVRRRAEFWGALAEDQGREWSLDVGAPGDPLPLPQADLEAVVDALMGNVFTHTPEGTPYQITVAGDELVVADAGPGMDADALTRGRSGAGSTGLGLDIVAKVARRYGGDVSVGTREGSGARVAVRFTPRR